MKIATDLNRLRTPRSAFRTRAAFTMVEIALCLAIIGFALVAIIGILPIGMSVQKDNREETIINFDAKYLMDAIRSGALGQDELTNFIVSITNFYTTYDAGTNLQGQGVNWYNNFTNSASGQANYNSSLTGVSPSVSFLTNGLNIIGLLTTPKFAPAQKGFFRSNYITADFRAITGSPMDQGSSTTSKDFAFTYRVFVEVNPFAVYDISLTNYAALPNTDPNRAVRFNYATLATNLQANLNEIRLRMRWPVLPNNQLGQGNQTFRTVASGQIRATNSAAVPLLTLYYFEPQSYIHGTQLLPGGIKPP